METKVSNFTAILLENEKAYFRHLEGIVSSVDATATIGITKRIEGLTVRITPTDYRTLMTILSEIKKLHTNLGIRVDFSKSMKASLNICFNIDVTNQSK